MYEAASCDATKPSEERRQKRPTGTSAVASTLFLPDSLIDRELGAAYVVTPNDFRNMFPFALLVSSMSFVVTTAIGRSRPSLLLRLALAPAVIYAWLWLGADGNTLKAGQPDRPARIRRSSRAVPVTV